jgi:hypothetical protein
VDGTQLWGCVTVWREACNVQFIVSNIPGLFVDSRSDVCVIGTAIYEICCNELSNDLEQSEFY